MLTAEQIREKIFRRAEEFRHCAREKKWSSAKYAYDSASRMAVFMELPESDMAALFGNRAYREDDSEPVVDGIFDEATVAKAYDECIKENRTFDIQPYPGNPTETEDYDSDVWSRQAKADSPYRVYRRAYREGGATRDEGQKTGATDAGTEKEDDCSRPEMGKLACLS